MSKKQQYMRTFLLPVNPSDAEWDEASVPPQIIRRSVKKDPTQKHHTPTPVLFRQSLPKPFTRPPLLFTQAPPPRFCRKQKRRVFWLLSFLFVLGFSALAVWYFSWRNIYRTYLVMNFADEAPRIVLLPELHPFESEEIIAHRVESQPGARSTQLPQQKPERVAFGVVQTSFAKAAKHAGVSYEIVDDLVDLFSDRIVFEQDFRAGDRFTIIYQDDSSINTKGTKAEPVLAAAVDIGAKRLIAARYIGTDGKARYFDKSGQVIGNGFLRYPLQFSRVSSYFSYARFHPILKQYRPHHGVDFAAPLGTPVRTVAGGKVIFAGSNGPNGIMVKIDHNERYSTAYLHLSNIPPGVTKGGFVSRGQIIGTVGATGLATGPHLHYSFFDRGQYVDPLKIQLPTVDILPEGAKISHNYLHRVLFTLAHYQDVDLDNIAL